MGQRALCLECCNGISLLTDLSVVSYIIPYHADVQEDNAIPQQFQSEFVSISSWEKSENHGMNSTIREDNVGFHSSLSEDHPGKQTFHILCINFVLLGTCGPMEIDSIPEEQVDCPWTTMNTQTEKPKVLVEVESKPPTTIEGTYFQHVSNVTHNQCAYSFVMMFLLMQLVSSTWNLFIY